MLTGEEEIAGGKSLQSGDGRELPWFVAGIATFHERIRRPMFEMCQVLSLRQGCGSEGARKDLVQIGQELLSFCLNCIWI